jgi:aspartyl-tRNA(Asn)/glutamyl-tRNA(Gln) amidotransferase subunit A
MTLLETGMALRTGKISVRELTEDALRRIEADQARLNAFLTVTTDAALKRADSLDADFARGMDRGILHGIPIAHKDCIQTRNIRTTSGSKIFADFVPDVDADVVTRMNDAGAVMVGKTGMHELAYGITSDNPHFGAVRNPWNTERVPGGSSGGSAAAVAAGLVAVATGTDTGGSIRVPASFCGVVGLKPTFERVSRRGVMPLGLTLDHVGPLARTVRDAAMAFHAMAEHTSGYVPPAHTDLHGLRIGVPSNFFFDRLEPEVTASVRVAVQTAASLGAHVTEVRVPDAEALNTVARLILSVEAAAVFSRHLGRRQDFGADVLALVEQGRLLAGTDYVDAQRLRRVLADEFSKLWLHLDCLITPATAVTAPKIGETEVVIGSVKEDVRSAATRLVRPFNALGWPALAMPCGISRGRLPIGLQLVAAPSQEDTLFQVGAALEDALGLKWDRTVEQR